METDIKVLIFNLNKEEFAADINQVERIIGFEKPREIPEAPSFIQGVLKHEEKIIPIINMNKKFKIKEENGENRKIIIIKRNEKKFGVMVDNVVEVKDIPDSFLEKPPEITINERSKFLEGIIKIEDRMIILLNLESILKKEEEIEIF